jgi:hypothetical protein
VLHLSAAEKAEAVHGRSAGAGFSAFSRIALARASTTRHLPKRVWAVIICLSISWGGVLTILSLAGGRGPPWPCSLQAGAKAHAERRVTATRPLDSLDACLPAIGPAVLQTFRMEAPGGLAAAALIPSCSCSVTDLADVYEVPEAARRELACGAGWQTRWEAGWRRDGTVTGGPVSDLGQILAGGCQPWRHFGWRTGQRHRPGLQFLVSTGRHHGFESLEEQRFLLRWISPAGPRT